MLQVQENRPLCQRVYRRSRKLWRVQLKRGSNFLVLNTDQDSSDDEVNVKFSHEHLLEVQENEQELESDFEEDMAKEEGTSTDDVADDEETESEDVWEGLVLLQDDILCSFQDKPAISKSWILMDSQSTVHVFCNPKLLSNIWDVKRTLTLYYNARKAIVNRKGDMKGLWYGMVPSRRYREHSVLA